MCSFTWFHRFTFHPKNFENMISPKNLITEKVRIAVITAEGVEPDKDHPLLEERLAEWLEHRVNPLTKQEDDFRKACRYDEKRQLQTHRTRKTCIRIPASHGK